MKKSGGVRGLGDTYPVLSGEELMVGNREGLYEPADIAL